MALQEYILMAELNVPLGILISFAYLAIRYAPRETVDWITRSGQFAVAVLLLNIAGPVERAHAQTEVVSAPSGGDIVLSIRTFGGDWMPLPSVRQRLISLEIVMKVPEAPRLALTYLNWGGPDEAGLDFFGEQPFDDDLEVRVGINEISNGHIGAEFDEVQLFDGLVVSVEHHFPGDRPPELTLLAETTIPLHVPIGYIAPYSSEEEYEMPVPDGLRLVRTPDGTVGEFEQQGDPELRVGAMLKFTNVDPWLVGSYRVTESRHRIDSTSGYRTQVRFESIDTVEDQLPDAPVTIVPVDTPDIQLSDEARQDAAGVRVSDSAAPVGIDKIQRSDKVPESSSDEPQKKR